MVDSWQVCSHNLCFQICVSVLLQVKSLKDEEFTDKGLTEGQSYNYRVAAENEVGIGAFAELPKPVTAKSEFGKKILSCMLCATNACGSGLS